MCRLKFTILFTDKAAGGAGGRLLAGRTEVQSPSVILMEMSTGTVLYEKNSDERNYPASITKIMTTLLALENSDLNEVVTFSDDAINNTEGSGIYRDYGEQMHDGAMPVRGLC